jgi:hypothetical protein
MQNGSLSILVYFQEAPPLKKSATSYEIAKHAVIEAEEGEEEESVKAAKESSEEVLEPEVESDTEGPQSKALTRNSPPKN